MEPVTFFFTTIITGVAGVRLIGLVLDGSGPFTLMSRIASVLGVTSDYLVDTTETVQVADAIDQAFFRKYRKMDPATKDKIRRMIELWGDEG